MTNAERVAQVLLDARVQKVLGMHRMQPEKRELLMQLALDTESTDAHFIGFAMGVVELAVGGEEFYRMLLSQAMRIADITKTIPLLDDAKDVA